MFYDPRQYTFIEMTFKQRKRSGILKKIVFINPKIRDMKVKIWSSTIMHSLIGSSVSSTLSLTSMVLAAITPPEYDFIYIDDELDEIDLQMEADLVAITAMTIQANRGYEIADHFRQRGIPVIIGGIHASVLPEEVSQHCDAVMVGEGEHAWLDILKDFERGSLKKIYNGKDYPPVKELISPRIDLVDHDRYLLYPIQATRGCPYDCDFCSVEHSSGHNYRMKPVAQVIAEIKAFEKYNKKKLGVYKKSYLFVDDNLYVNRNYIKELFTAMIGLDITWTAQGTINVAFDEEILELMAKSGCRAYGLGLESISEETLKEANKPKINKTNTYDVAFQNLIRHGIVPAGYLIYGFDTDDYQVFERTVDFALKNHLMQPFFNILTPYPGTRVYDKIKAEGRIIEENWDRYNSQFSVFTPKQMSAALLEEGAGWSVKKIAEIDVIKKQLDYFWSHGPWPYLRALTRKERLFLVLLGLKLKKYDKEYGKFLFWAARKKNACDFGSIVAALVLYEVIKEADIGKSFENLIQEEKHNRTSAHKS